MTYHILTSLPIASGFFRLKQTERVPFFERIQKALEEPDHTVFNQIETIRARDHFFSQADLALSEARIGQQPQPLQDGHHFYLLKDSPAGWEYYEGSYIERAPVPAWRDLMSLDIYEPSAQRYIKDLYHLTGGQEWRLLERTRGLMAEVDGLTDDWREYNQQYIDLLRMHFDWIGFLGTHKFE